MLPQSEAICQDALKKPYRPNRRMGGSVSSSSPRQSTDQGQNLDLRNRHIELNGLLYTLTDSGSARCEVPYLERDFPRNFVCIEGYLYSVSLFIRSQFDPPVLPADTPRPFLVIPRMADVIGWERRMDHVSVLSFEFGCKVHHIQAGPFSFNFALRSICVPASVALLDRKCFRYCLQLSCVTFEPGSKLRAIEFDTFHNCSSLQSIEIPASVELLGGSCFSDCRSLSSLTFEPGSKLTRIAVGALYGCTSLESICLPVALQTIEYAALAGTGISKITVEEGNVHLRVSGDFLLDCDGTSLIRYFGFDRIVTLDAHIEILCSGALLDCQSISVLIFESGSKLTRFEAKALSGCSSLQSLCIPASVEILGEGCFAGCKSLSSLTFESGSKLTRIEGHVIDRCSSLRSICIPASVEILCEHCFAESEISSLAIESGSNLTRIEGSALCNCSLLQSLCIPAPVEIFGAKCFSGCKSLRSLTFETGSKLTRIESYALLGCSSLQSLCIPPSVEILAEGCFFGCSSLSSLTFESGSKLARIEARVFYFCCSLHSICIPASVQTIMVPALAGTSIPSISLEAENRCFHVLGNCLMDSKGITAIIYLGNENAVLDRTIRILGSYCFSRSVISSLTFEPGSMLTRIEERAFERCLLLRSICIPASVEIICNCCFSSCYELSSFVFESGSKIQEIQGHAFQFCSALKSIRIPGSIRELAKYWAQHSSLSLVVFESAASLERLIKRHKADLRGRFALAIAHSDCRLSFPGYFIDPVPHGDDLIHLVKRSQ
jgi:hypothetical protein